MTLSRLVQQEFVELESKIQQTMGTHKGLLADDFHAKINEAKKLTDESNGVLLSNINSTLAGHGVREVFSTVFQKVVGQIFSRTSYIL